MALPGLRRLRALLFRRHFVSIPDTMAGKPLHLYLREDSMMERFFLKDGLYGNWEKESLKIWATLSRTAAVVVDVGANTGVFSLIAQNNNAKAMVLAVEPIDVNHDVLIRNIRKNAFSIRPEKVALSETEGTATMYMLKDRLNYMTSINDNRYLLHPEIQGGQQVVPTRVVMKPFSYLVERHGLKRMDLVKMDVEGHESAVLRSMLPFVREWKPDILIEIIGDDNATNVQAMIQPLGYQFVAIHEDRPSEVVDRLWDNDHHNFLLCSPATINRLKQAKLVAP